MAWADDDLIRRAKQGDPDAWRELYREHAGRLLAWLRLRPTGDTAMSAEDLAAEAWFVAASKIAGFRGTSEEFAGWLFGTARKLHANARRTSGRRATTPEPPEQLIGMAGTVEDGGDHIAWVRSVLAPLPAREREAVGLVDALGMDPRIAAEALGISGVALRVARHRGLGKLRLTERAAIADLLRDAPGG